LTRVAAGETVEVDRHGEIVAVVVPPRRTLVSGAALRSLLERLPRPDDRFADDVRELAAVVTPPGDPWPA
jgi:antitoxin (DNA-binding transcriptional repressor) of toxin-antitoxin stability system